MKSTIETDLKKRKEQISILKKFMKSLPALEKLRKINGEKGETQKLGAFKNAEKTLLPLYQKKLREVRKYIRENSFKNERLFSQTVFEVMDREAREEAHSNVIAYLLRQKSKGSKLLKAIVEQIPQEMQNNIAAEMESDKYEVIREKTVSSKRIDIFIQSGKFIIAIENKFYARLHNIDEETNQTAFYFKEIIRRYPHHQKLFIILDYKEEEESENYAVLGYGDLLNAMEKVKNEFQDDNIFIEYYYLLHRLLSNLTAVAIEGLGSINSLSLLSGIKKEVEYGFIKRAARI